MCTSCVFSLVEVEGEIRWDVHIDVWASVGRAGCDFSSRYVEVGSLVVCVSRWDSSWCVCGGEMPH